MRYDRRRPDRAFTLLAWCLGFAGLFSASVALALVPNGDFADLSGGALSGWRVGELAPPAPIPEKGVVKTPRGVAISLDAGSAGPGSHALKMASEGLTGDDYGLALSSRFPLVPGYEYEMSVRYRAQGLTRENLDRTGSSAFMLDLFMEGPAGRVGGARILTSANAKAPVTLDLLTNYTTRFRVPAGAQWGVARAQLVNKYKNAPVTVWVEDVVVEPLDPVLANGGMEAADPAGGPQGWRPYGAAKTSWSAEAAHSGKHSASVSDAPDGALSGWSAIVPVRADRAYAFSGYVKAGLLNPNGAINGGALEVQFLDKEGQPLGPGHLSPAVGANTDWTLVATPKVRPPPGAATARLIAGLKYASGVAWFDDLSLAVDAAEAPRAARVKIRQPGPSAKVRYAANLLINGDVEAGENGQPAGWTYVGSAAPDWTREEIIKLHSQGRPDFSIGRGRGEWSHEAAFAGQGALLNASIDPPLSTKRQWYGRNPVDGFWLSAPIACQAGKRYLAAAWLKPGNPLTGMWLGPLEVRFYDAKGGPLEPAAPMRSGMGRLPAGAWSYYATLPYVAPKNAATMRLRFGQEFAADTGGWGRTFGDNFALWELPAGAPSPDKSAAGNDAAFREWFKQATAALKPPYLAAPAEAPAYESVWGKVNNSVPGNLYFDPKAPISAAISLVNLLGENRTVSLRATPYDSWGEAGATIVAPDIFLAAASAAEVKVELPAAGKYGAYYLDADILDGEAVVGKANGRYAVMPPPLPGAEAPQKAKVAAAGSAVAPDSWENPFGVSVLAPISGHGRPFERELGVLLKAAGFGIAWTRLYYDPTPADIRQKLASLKRELAYYHGLGLRAVVQLMPNLARPVRPERYEAAGRMIGAELKDQAAALGNWGIEQANSGSPYRGGGTDRWTDAEYDSILAAQYDGVKSAAPDLPVLIGNIATDLEAKTIRRLYGSAPGKFDGSIMNAYFGQMLVAEAAFEEYDAHGDSWKTIWGEEQADQRSPFEGEARRYGEISGADAMVRTWLAMLGKFSPRLKAVTMWGFVTSVEEDTMMATPSLQPRPQYVAHAVMADALKGAAAPEDLSSAEVSLFKWRRPAGPLLAAWAKSGEREVAFEAPSGGARVTDIMGNSRMEQAVEGVLTLKLTASPVYLSEGGEMAVIRRPQ